MFSLISGIYEALTKKRTFNILLIGLSGSGKTTFLEQVKEKYTGKGALPHELITETLGMNLLDFTFKGNRFKMWDLGGSLPSVWRDYFKDCHGVLFMVNTSQIEELPKVKKEIGQLIHHEQLSRVPKVVLLNCFGDGKNEKNGGIDERFMEIAAIWNKSSSSKSEKREMERNLMMNDNEVVSLVTVNSRSGNGIDSVFLFLNEFLEKNARDVSEDEFV